MAEIAVNFIIDKLVPLFHEESKLLKGVRREANSLIDELKMIKPFLNKADEMDERGELDDDGKAWIKQVRKVSYQIEDAIDEYILHLARRPQQRGFIGFFYKVDRLIKTLKPRRDIASEIKNIKATISDIKERGETYGFSFGLQGSSSSGNDVAWRDPRVASLFIGEDEVVGIESQRDELVSWLVEGSPKRVAISVVGMGGSGKTTLTKKVYDNPIVTAHFDFHAWIPVSQPFKMEDVLKAIIKQFYQAMKRNAPDQEMDKMDFMSLMEKLKDCLDQKRYVIFFDDVWDQNFWSLIRLALPDNDKGNRVVMTTRNNDVAASCKESQFDRIKELRPLSPDKAWELFCKKAFQADFGGICPSELEDLSRDIVKRCEGLPLALVTIGGVLATKEKVIHQWKTFSDSLGSELGSNPRFKGAFGELHLLQEVAFNLL
ncbi:hypothetical protein U1Q18_044162 [Sarracenia purpurea var. burkii]